VDNIKICIKEIGSGDVGWIHPSQDRDQKKPYIYFYNLMFF